MPLDPIARRYAEALLTNATEEAVQKMQTDLVDTRENHRKRNTFMSGLYIKLGKIDFDRTATQSLAFPLRILKP